MAFYVGSSGASDRQELRHNVAIHGPQWQLPSLWLLKLPCPYLKLHQLWRWLSLLSNTGKDFLTEKQIKDSSVDEENPIVLRGGYYSMS